MTVVPFLVGGEPLQEAFEVGVQSRLVIIDEHRGGDVHGIHQAQTLTDA